MAKQSPFLKLYITHTRLRGIKTIWQQLGRFFLLKYRIYRYLATTGQGKNTANLVNKILYIFFYLNLTIKDIYSFIIIFELNSDQK